MATVTPNFKFVLPSFNQKPWQQAYYDALNAIDALLAKYIVVNNYQGPWANSTVYAVGQVVTDLTSGLLFKCLVAHTSTVAPNTFLTDRKNNPTFWQAYTFQIQFRGVWAAGMTYAAGDFVTFSKKLAVALTNHTSTAFAADQTSGFWSVVVDGDVLTPFPTLSANVLDQGRVAVVDPTGVFYTITPQGIGWQNAHSQWQIAAGSAAFPSLNFQSDPTTGLFSVAAGSLGIAVSGALVAKFTAAGLDITSFANNALTNAKLAQAAAFTVKGNPTSALANLQDMSVAQLITMLGIQNYLTGLGTALNGVTPNTKIDVAAGVATDGTNALTMIYAGGTVDAGVVGLNGIDVGALAATSSYHLWLIAKADGSIPGLLLSLSATAPTMPATYTLKRRISSHRTDGSSHLVAYIQNGDYFEWSNPSTDDISGAANPSVAANVVVNIPTGIIVLAFLSFGLFTSSSNASGQIRFYNPAMATVGDFGPVSAAGSSMGGIVDSASATVLVRYNGTTWARTNTSGQIRVLGDATSTASYSARVLAWLDTRGK